MYTYQRLKDIREDADKKQEDTSDTKIFPFVLGMVLNFVP